MSNLAKTVNTVDAGVGSPIILSDWALAWSTCLQVMLMTLPLTHKGEALICAEISGLVRHLVETSVFLLDSKPSLRPYFKNSVPQRLILFIEVNGQGNDSNWKQYLQHVEWIWPAE